jgi:hypothetical protein
VTNAAAVVPAGEAELEPELVPIKEICGGAVKYMSESGRRYIYMEGLHFLAKGVEKQMNALLCLNYPNPTYPTKLYLAANLGLGLNWNETASFLAKPWYSWSWKDVSPNQSPFAILAGHLEAFR